jgi:hypothetical protein
MNSISLKSKVKISKIKQMLFFIKSVKIGVVCDEGSYLVRLFGQLFFEENEPQDQNSPG